MRRADLFLGRSYSIRGTVVKGNCLGKTIGFPTCNIGVDEGMAAPANGVYLTETEVGGKVYDSITNVGVKPTVGVNEKNIETNLFGFDEDIYGSEIRVGFIEKIRDEKKFGSVEELAEQIGKDCEKAKIMHENRR